MRREVRGEGRGAAALGFGGAVQPIAWTQHGEGASIGGRMTRAHSEACAGRELDFQHLRVGCYGRPRREQDRHGEDRITLDAVDPIACAW